MTTYLQRQISSFCGVGSNTDPVTYSIAQRTWTQQDVYPSKILKLADGKQEADEFQIAHGANVAIKLPQNYDPTKRLFVALRVSLTAKVVTTSAEPASTVLVRAGASSGQDGILSFVALGVTNVQVYNPSLTLTMTVETFLYEYPDLNAASSWRDGTQTVGIVST